MSEQNKNKTASTNSDLMPMAVFAIIVILMLTIIVLLTANSEQRNMIDALSSENAKYEAILGYVDIHNCACGGHAELVLDEPLDCYYIKCEECGLRTSYYDEDERQELIEYWENLFE